MAKKKQQEPSMEEILDTEYCEMVDYRGGLVCVPRSKLDAWVKQQEKLKRNPPEEPYAEITPEMLDKMIELMGGGKK